MPYEKEPDHPGRGKTEFEKFKSWGSVIMIAIAILFGLALQESKANTEIDLQKDVYLFLHGRRDLQENAENALVTRGFLKEKIIVATPNKVGNVGDYMAMLWKPPDPDQIKIQQITGVKEVEPEGMAGLWKGVSRKDIDTIRLE